ncbi:hypothetical protein NP115_23135 [Salmonella enterica]|nr:hypothetical protein [Salmonella enterica]
MSGNIGANPVDKWAIRTTAMIARELEKLKST